MTMLLREGIELEQSRIDGLTKLGDKGVVNPENLRKSELRLLSAQQQLALHKKDQAGADEAFRRALEIEMQHLERLEILTERGIANQTMIARQKLRIARLIAEGLIEPAEIP